MRVRVRLRCAYTFDSLHEVRVGEVILAQGPDRVGDVEYDEHSREDVVHSASEAREKDDEHDDGAEEDAHAYDDAVRVDLVRFTKYERGKEPREALWRKGEREGEGERG